MLPSLSGAPSSQECTREDLVEKVFLTLHSFTTQVKQQFRCLQLLLLLKISLCTLHIEYSMGLEPYSIGSHDDKEPLQTVPCTPALLRQQQRPRTPQTEDFRLNFTCEDNAAFASIVRYTPFMLMF